uniref:Prefoldin subunit 2 n=1 Tax=Schistocephalus solidus TaxID=70667 RepID=A0A183T0D2_SCHSO
LLRSLLLCVSVRAKMSAVSDVKRKPLTEEQIVEGFQKLRYEQRAIGNKISGIQMDQREHNMVIKVLKGVDSERKCFRLIDGVLVERQVKHVLPALEANEKKMAEYLETLHKQFEEKGRELQAYKEENKIKIAGEDERSSGEQKKEEPASSSGVLVT